MVQAFADLEALLTSRKRWRDLEGAYVRMIQRLPKGPEAAAGRIALWKTLGELYRRVLNDVEGARMAYEVAAKADPGDVAALEAHAELAAKCSAASPRRSGRTGGSSRSATPRRPSRRWSGFTRR
jgi:cytochrome c-type biogenesis protein CcmH/NrfG